MNIEDVFKIIRDKKNRSELFENYQEEIDEYKEALSKHGRPVCIYVYGHEHIDNIFIERSDVHKIAELMASDDKREADFAKYIFDILSLVENKSFDCYQTEVRFYAME
jgi:hypothetical protein